MTHRHGDRVARSGRCSATPCARSARPRSPAPPPRRNAAGHDLGTVDLEPTVFGLEPNRAVLHQVVTAQLAAARAGTQSTKTRAEVRGGGAKPFRQKGTGRARQGSSRSPSMSRRRRRPRARSRAATPSAPPRRWSAWPCSRP